MEKIQDNFNAIKQNFQSIASTCERLERNVRAILEGNQKIEAKQQETINIEKGIVSGITEINEFSVNFIEGFEDSVLKFNPYLEVLNETGK